MAQDTNSVLDEVLGNTAESTDDVTKIKKYIKQILALEIEAKRIKDDIKQVKKDAKDEEIDVKIIDKAIREYKKQIKEKPTEKEEVETILGLLEEDRELSNSFYRLVD